MHLYYNTTMFYDTLSELPCHVRVLVQLYRLLDKSGVN